MTGLEESDQSMTERIEKLRVAIERDVDDALKFRQPGRIIPAFVSTVVIDQNDHEVVEAIMEPYRQSGWSVQVDYFVAQDVGWLILLTSKSAPKKPTKRSR